MLFLFSLLPGTILLVVGYFVLFASSRAEGGVKRFGQYLAVWIFFLVTVLVLGGLLASALGMQDPISRMTQHMQLMEQHMELLEQQLIDQRPAP